MVGNQLGHESLAGAPDRETTQNSCQPASDFDGQHHPYSVPYRHARAEVEARFTVRTVEIFLRGERIAVHARGSGNGKHTTIAEHMPSSHRRYGDWTIARIHQEATRLGPSVATLCTLILERRPHPEQGFRACIGILRLARSVGADRLDAAAERALTIGTLTYSSVKSILDHRLERAAGTASPDPTPIRHPNIRGGGYFH